MTLSGLTLLAAALRLIHLDSVPPGLFLDEAGNGLDALEVLGGRLSLFFERSLGKEPLLNYLITPFVAWLGREPLAVRLPAALAGVLAVPATFFLARELLWEEGEDKATWAGLFAAGLLAASYWAITLNRISFRANTLPLAAATAFALAWWTLRVGGKGKAVLAGGLLGLCFYTYLAGRFVYPLALVALGLLALTQQGRAQLRRRRGELVIMALVAAAVMAPLLAYFAGHPDDFLRRAGQVAFTNPLLDDVTPAARLRRSLLGNLAMFGGVGDLEPRHNLPGRSLLTPWLAALFWLGVALALVQGRRPQRWFAVAWFGFFLLPAILAATPPRHALRAIGAQPIVYFLCALAIVEIAGWLAGRRRARQGRPAGAAWAAPPALLSLALVGLVALETVGTATTYFGRWARDPITFYAYLGQDRAIAEEINQAATDVRYIVPLNDRWRELGGKYTLDFLVRQRDRVLFFFPQAPDAAARLATFVGQPGVREVRVVRMVEGDDVSADPQETATLLLGQEAQRTAIYDGLGYYVEVFKLAASGPASLRLPQPEQPLQVRFSDTAGRRLLLTGWGVAPSQAASAHVTAGGLGAVALRWLAEDPPSQHLRVSLRLVDALRQPVGQADSPLVDTRPRYNPDWQVGDDAMTYHQITAAPGTPPGAYTLLVSVYDAATQARLAAAGADSLPREWVELGPVQVAQPLPGAPAYTPAQALTQPAVLASGLTLLGHDALPAAALPGLPLNLALVWQAAGAVAEQSLAVLLGDHPVGQLALAPLPPGRWRTTHQVLLPADLASGERRLALRVDPPDGQPASVELGVVAVEEPPQPQQALQADFVNGAALVGWRSDPHPDGVAVTLFWQTERPLDQELTVFLHVVDSAGRLLAQHDAAPDGGRLPTTLWPTGVLIPDRHVVAIPALTGDLHLRAGLYLPGSGVRIPQAEGDDFVEWVAAPGASP